MDDNKPSNAIPEAWDYQPPVSKLLTLGRPLDVDESVNYLELGLRQGDIADLIRLATDERLLDVEADTDDIWGPIHAWRALGELRAVQAVEPLLSLLHRVDDKDDDWVSEDVRDVLVAIGPAALPAVSAYLADQARGPWARAVCAGVIGQIGQEYQESRDECVRLLTNELERFALNPPLVNADIIASLIELHAVEAAPVMERAFAAGAVQLSVAGDWEDVQIELGLKDHRDTPQHNYILEELGLDPGLLDVLGGKSPLPAASAPRRDPWQVERARRDARTSKSKSRSKANSRQKRQQKKQTKHKKK